MSCMWAHFRIGSHTMPGQQDSRPTLTSTPAPISYLYMFQLILLFHTDSLHTFKLSRQTVMCLIAMLNTSSPLASLLQLYHSILHHEKDCKFQNSKWMFLFYVKDISETSQLFYMLCCNAWHGHCHLWLWLIELRSVALSSCRLSHTKILWRVLLPMTLEDFPILLLQAILSLIRLVSWVRKGVNKLWKKTSKHRQ